MQEKWVRKVIITVGLIVLAFIQGINYGRHSVYDTTKEYQDNALKAQKEAKEITERYQMMIENFLLEQEGIPEDVI